MKGYSTDIEKQSLENTAFRRVLFTGKNMQLVLMSLKPGEDIGSEVHQDRDQFFRVEAGQARAEVGEDTWELADGSIVVVPAGSRHNITNTSKDAELKLYTLYAPPEHPDGTIHKTKADALED